MRAHILTLAAVLVMPGCGSTDRPDSASDPAPGAAGSSTAEPTVGSYPSYLPEDYAYTQHVACFCPDAQAGVRVEVRDGKVTAAVYTRSGGGHHQGDPAATFRWLTINDIIAAANDTSAARVDVTWPDGQDYPTEVYVDRSETAVDEEVGYRVSDVEVA